MVLALTLNLMIQRRRRALPLLRCHAQPPKGGEARLVARRRDAVRASLQVRRMHRPHGVWCVQEQSRRPEVRIEDVPVRLERGREASVQHHEALLVQESAEGVSGHGNAARYVGESAARLAWASRAPPGTKTKLLP